MERYSVKWRESDNRDRIVAKKKNFKTDQQRERFVSALTVKENFHEIISWSDRSAAR
jgi:hypothetical protein